MIAKTKQIIKERSAKMRTTIALYNYFIFYNEFKLNMIFIAKNKSKHKKVKLYKIQRNAMILLIKHFHIFIANSK